MRSALRQTMFCGVSGMVMGGWQAHPQSQILT
jgi:hypothetical protein